MPLFFDSHAHLDAGAFDQDRAAVIAGLEEAQVGRVINVGCDLASSEASDQLARQYPNIWAAVGTHPEDAGNLTPETLDRYRDLVRAPGSRVCAIGEIGLDYHYPDGFAPDVQRETFRLQLELAVELGMPVIFHVRDAIGEAMAIVREYAGKLPGGVFHCFSGSAETALELAKLGLYVGFTGVLTFPNARRAIEAAQAMPLDRILIETDCPYMAPVPHRGKRNDSRLVPLVGKKLAEVRGISEEEAAKATWQNTCRLFRLPE